MLDLGQPRGLELLLALVARADVFVQNFRPGVAERMGIGEAALRRVAPDLVYVSISGFGETGPYAQRRVYDIVIQALSGMAVSQADPSTGEPELVRNIVADKATALVAAQAITAALFARERGAGGQHVRLAMLDATIAFLWPDVMQVLHLSRPRRDAAGLARRLPVGAPHARRPHDDLRDPGRRVRRLVPRARPPGADARRALPRHGRPHAPCRRAGRAARRGTRAQTTASLCARLEAEDVPHAPVNRLETLHEDAQVVANALLVEMEHPSAGRMRTPRPVARFDATPASLRRPPPLLGEHGAELLRELGLSAGEIDDLRAKQILG